MIAAAATLATLATGATLCTAVTLYVRSNRDRIAAALQCRPIRPHTKG